METIVPTDPLVPLAWLEDVESTLTTRRTQHWRVPAAVVAATLLAAATVLVTSRDRSRVVPRDRPEPSPTSQPRQRSLPPRLVKRFPAHRPPRKAHRPPVHRKPPVAPRRTRPALPAPRPAA